MIAVPCDRTLLSESIAQTIDSGVMIDLIHLRIFFKPSLLTIGWQDFESADAALSQKVPCLIDVGALGVPTHGETFRNADGTKSIRNERHAFESLPSSYSGIAFKIYDGTDLRGVACVELKFSPAKILQGHNLFGPNDLSLCSYVGILSLSIKYPQLFALLCIDSIEVVQFDVTYSTHVESRAVYVAVFDTMQNLSRGHAKSARDHFTIYFYSKKSRSLRIKIYGKEEEFAYDLKKVFRSARNCPVARRRLEVMTDPRLMAFTENLVRFEATLGPRFFDDRQISRRLKDLIKLQKEQSKIGVCCFSIWWKIGMKKIFELFESNDIRVIDDSSIVDAVREAFVNERSDGRRDFNLADRIVSTYMLIRHRGYKAAKGQIKVRTFQRHCKCLRVVGISRAQLMNFTAESLKNEFFPIIKFIEIDFSARGQRPDWYVEPTINIDLLIEAALAA